VLYGIFLVASAVAAYFAWRSRPEFVRFEFDALSFEDLEENEEDEANENEDAVAY